MVKVAIFWNLATPGRISCAPALMISLALIAVIFVADFSTGADIQLHILYAVPSSFFAFHCANRMLSLGVTAISFACQVVTLYFDRLDPTALVSNIIIGLGTILATTWLASIARENYQIMEHQTITDPLTKLLNRRGFDDALQREFEWQRRFGTVISIAMIDLDGFKILNDTMGHGTGDKVLCKVARALLHATRAVDTIARLGGDEFCVLMPGAQEEDSKRVAEALRLAIVRETRDAGYEVTASVGTETFPNAPTDVQAALESVDKLMYEAKRAGKNRIFHNSHHDMN
jgi:diguanylate cyclase (GGDEF)-like protein